MQSNINNIYELKFHFSFVLRNLYYLHNMYPMLGREEKNKENKIKRKKFFLILLDGVKKERKENEKKMTFFCLFG